MKKSGSSRRYIFWPGWYARISVLMYLAFPLALIPVLQPYGFSVVTVGFFLAVAAVCIYFVFEDLARLVLEPGWLVVDCLLWKKRYRLHSGTEVLTRRSGFPVACFFPEVVLSDGEKLKLLSLRIFRESVADKEFERIEKAVGQMARPPQPDDSDA